MSPGERRFRPARPSVPGLEGLLAFHRLLLEDPVRNRAFRRSLAGCVTPATAVLDIGAGTGLWALEAARLGARRVVAVEREPMLVPIVEAAVAESGLGGRVEVVAGDSRTLALPRAFDVVVSETVGNLGLDEEIVPILADARRRFLRPGGTLIPESLELRGAPAEVPVRNPSTRGTVSAFGALAIQVPRALEPGSVRRLARARRLMRVDFRRVRKDFRPGRVEAAWTLPDGARVSGIAVWVRLELGAGSRLETLEGTHWRPLLFGVEPLPRGPGRLELRLDLAPPAPGWEIAWRSPRGTVSRVYSSLLAYGWLKSRIRTRRRKPATR